MSGHTAGPFKREFPDYVALMNDLKAAGLARTGGRVRNAHRQFLRGSAITTH